jgi:hypothetical protein
MEKQARFCPKAGHRVLRSPYDKNGDDIDPSSGIKEDSIGYRIGSECGLGVRRLQYGCCTWLKRQAWLQFYGLHRRQCVTDGDASFFFL